MKFKLEKEQKIYFSFIIILCILAIGIAIAIPMMGGTGEKKENQTISEEKEETLKANFTELFLNQVNIKEQDLSGINRIEKEKDLVFTSYEKTEKQDGKYELTVSIPKINIQNDQIRKDNEEIKKIFQDKAESIILNQINAIYEVKYNAFVVDQILSLVIKSTLKEGSNPQRIIIKTYHYDLKEQKGITIYDALSKKNISEEKAQSKILEEIKKKNMQTNQLEQLGYQVYVRDETSSQYLVENTTNFFMDHQGNLYVIYAYGNNKNTSELDMIIF